MIENYGLNKKYKPVCDYRTAKNRYLIVEISRIPQPMGDKVEFAIYTFDGEKVGERLGKAKTPREAEEKYAK